MADDLKPRDETAFSLNAETGTPVASAGSFDRGHLAQQALDAGVVDEAGYHRILEDDTEAEIARIALEAKAEGRAP